MAVRFILGRAGTGKTWMCVDEAVRALREGGSEPLVLLVPEQATYQMERAVLGREGIEGYSRLRIMSFDRLRAMLCPHPAGRSELSRLGRQLILQRIVEDSRDQLKLFRPEGDLSGLCGRLADFVTELYHADAQPADLVRFAEEIQKENPGSQTAMKLFDFACLFQGYQDFLASQAGNLTDPEVYLRHVRQKAAGCEALRGMRLWVDGFSGFTTHELGVLVELLKLSREASIALCLDPERIDPDGEAPPVSDTIRHFDPTEQTYFELKKICKNARLSLGRPILLTSFPRFAKAHSLGLLEQILCEDETPPEFAEAANGNLKIFALPDMRSECMWAARQIGQFVREKAYRYRDIAVVVPPIETYQNLLTWAFERQGIPYFLDRPRPLKAHPAAQLIDAALRAVLHFFALDDMTAYMKTGLTGPEDFELDLLDNYCRACGVEGGDWLLERPWDFADPGRCSFDLAQIDASRRAVIGPLRRLQEALGLPEGREIAPPVFTRVLWNFLGELNIPARLAQWAATDPSDQQYGHRQFQEKLVETLDEIGTICAGRTKPAEFYIKLIQTAFETLTVKLIPPALDQVLIGSIERSRHPDIQALLLLGATQKDFPVPLRLDALLSDEDRALLAPMEFAPAEPLESQLMRRRYLAYIALTRSAGRVYLSYPMADENGNPVQAWSGLTSIQGAFPDLRILHPAAGPETPEQVQTRSELEWMLCERLGRDSATDDPQRELAAALYERMTKAGDPSAALLEAALGYDNEASLETHLAGQCHAEPLNLSISRLQTFASCPYKFFVQYVLKLQRRRLARLEPVDFGTFFHEVLDRLFRDIRGRGLDWRGFRPEELWALCEKTASEIIERDTVLQSYIRHSKHHEYLLSCAVGQVCDLAEAVREMVCAGEFVPAGTEVEFDRGKDLPAIVLQTKQGRIVHIRGKIDRIDLWKRNGRTAAVVFDYKRSAKAVNWGHLYHGLDIQLPVYLMALKDRTLNGVRIDEPAGAFFMPILAQPKSKTLSEADGEAETFGYKVKGLFVGEAAGGLDGSAQQWSRYYNLYVDGEGGCYKYFRSTGALNRRQFERLMEHTKETAGRLADQILAGDVRIAPYRIARTSPCSYCDYRAVCRFDWQINDYRLLESAGKAEMMMKLGAMDEESAVDA